MEKQKPTREQLKADLMKSFIDGPSTKRQIDSSEPSYRNWRLMPGQEQFAPGGRQQAPEK